MAQSRKQTTVVLAAGAVLVAAVAALWIVRPSGNASRTGAAGKLTVETPALETSPGRWRVLAASRDAFVQDKLKLNAQVTLRPVMGTEPDSITELRIVKLVPDSPLFAAGLRVDDVIREVNGTPLISMSRAINLANEIGSSSRLTARVERARQILLYDVVFE